MGPGFFAVSLWPAIFFRSRAHAECTKSKPGLATYFVLTGKKIVARLVFRATPEGEEPPVCEKNHFFQHPTVQIRLRPIFAIEPCSQGGKVLCLRRSIEETMNLDAILIDDDPWVRAEWAEKCKKNGKNIIAAASLEDLRGMTKGLTSIPKQTSVFVDVQLGNDENGVEMARKLAAQGWTNLWLSTAHDGCAFDSLAFIRGTIGKDPPAWLLAVAKISQKLSHAEQADLLSSMSAEQRALFDMRMRDYENAIYAIDGSSWLDGVGTHYPEEVLDAWERAIYESVRDDELKHRIQDAWRESLHSSKL